MDPRTGWRQGAGVTIAAVKGKVQQLQYESAQTHALISETCRHVHK